MRPTMSSFSGRTLPQRARTAPVLALVLTLATAALLIVSGFGPGRAYAAEASPPASKAWAWGNNNQGQLGDGTTTDRYTPTQVSGLKNFVDVSAGGVHALALRSDGTVWAWGDNFDGQLGNGTRTDSYTPTQVGGLGGVVDVDAGSYHSLAVKEDGTVWAWGDNYSGELGDGTTTNRKTPVQVNGLGGVVDIEAGGFSVALSTMEDTNGPKVERVVPAENAAGVGPATNVTAFFSEAMKAGSVNASTVKLYKVGTAGAVGAKVRYDPAAYKAVLDPEANLKRGAKYKVVVTPGTTD